MWLTTNSISHCELVCIWGIWASISWHSPLQSNHTV